MDVSESEEEGERTKQSVKQKLKMEIGYIRYRVANQLASSNPSLKLDDQRLSNILSTLNTPTHPPYALMINSAIAELNEEGGTSESGISAFIAKTYENLPLAHEAILKHHLRILCERREVACTDDELYILLTNSKTENGPLKTKPGKRKRGRERGIGIGRPRKSKRKNGGGEENQPMVLESEGVIEAVEDQSKRTGTKSDNRDPNLIEGVKKVTEVAQAKQLGIGSEENKPHPVQTDLSENQLQLEAAEPSGKGQQQVKPAESNKTSLSRRPKLNTQVETQRRKLRSYSRQSADADELPVPAHQAKHQEKEEKNQLMVLESEGVTEAVEDQSEMAGTKSDNRVPNLNEGVKEVMEVAQAKQLGIGSEESEPQTEPSENQLQSEAAEPSGEGQQRVKPAELKKPSLSQRRKPNIPAETQRRKLRSYSRHSAESDTDGATPKPPLPAHQAKHQEEENDQLCSGIETSSEKELSLSRPLLQRTLRSCSKLLPVRDSSIRTLTLSTVLSEDPLDPEPDTALSVSNPLEDPPRKKRGRPRKVNATMPLAVAPPPKRDGRGRPRKLKPEADAELALASPPPKCDGRGRPRKLKPEADADLALALQPPKRDLRGRPRKLKPEADAELALASRPVERRGRGRPRKAPKIAEMPLAVFRPGSGDHHENHKAKGKARPAKSKSKSGTEMVIFRPWDGRFRSRVRGQDSATRL